MPKISVIIPTYNCGKYIPEAIDSVLSQTYKDLEIIVIDDGSTDNTKEVLKKYEGKIRYICRERGGVSKARNSGLKIASGQYIAFLDADDIWLPEKLEKQTAFLSENKEVDFVACDLVLFDENGALDGTYFGRSGFEYSLKVIDNGFKIVLEKNFCNLSAALIRKRSHDKIGLFDDRIVCGEDLDLFLRAAAYSKVGVIPEALVKRRVYNKKTRSSSIDLDIRKDSFIYILEKIKKLFPNIISREKIDIGGLKAKTYLDYGYEHFTRDEFLKARLDFRKSLSERVSWRAFVFYVTTFLGGGAILWLKRLKSRLTSLA